MATQSVDKKWFPAKSYGWGWGLPKVWQGWVVLLGCLGIGFAPYLYFSFMYQGDTYCKELLAQQIKVSCDPSGASSVYILGSVMWLVGWILLLSIIASKKGDTLSWRWGGKSKHASKPKAD